MTTDDMIKAREQHLATNPLTGEFHSQYYDGFLQARREDFEAGWNACRRQIAAELELAMAKLRRTEQME